MAFSFSDLIKQGLGITNAQKAVGFVNQQAPQVQQAARTFLPSTVRYIQEQVVNPIQRFTTKYPTPMSIPVPRPLATTPSGQYTPTSVGKYLTTVEPPRTFSELPQFGAKLASTGVDTAMSAFMANPTLMGAQTLVKPSVARILGNVAAGAGLSATKQYGETGKVNPSEALSSGLSFIPYSFIGGVEAKPNAFRDVTSPKEVAKLDKYFNTKPVQPVTEPPVIPITGKKTVSGMLKPPTVPTTEPIPPSTGIVGTTEPFPWGEPTTPVEFGKPKSKAKQIMWSEAQQQADIANLQAAGNKPQFIDIVKRYFGNLEAAGTKGAKAGYEIKDVPKGTDPMEIVKAIEDPKKKVSPAIATYMERFRQLDNEVFAKAKQAGIDISYLRDHITHFWQNSPQEVEAAYNRFSRTFGPSKQRKIPTYEEGIKLGLTPKYTSPAQILGESVRQLERVKAGLQAFEEMKKQGAIVPAAVGKNRPGFAPIEAPGFPSSNARVNEGTVKIGNWYAPTELASIINKAFSPAPDNGIIGSALSTAAKASGIVQDVTMSGGVPKTPLNAFTFANVLKEVMAGRIAAPIKSFFTSLTDKGSKEFFNKNADQIVKMQQRDIPIQTNLSISDLAPKAKNLGNIWHSLVNDPTFKRFMPSLQVNLFNDIESQALKMGKSEAEAADIAAAAVKQFYGSSSTFTNYTRPQLTKDVTATFFFAPKFRESMGNFWINNVKALKNPMALENRTNIKFIGGTLLTLGAMNYLNEKFTGHGMLQNPPGTQDKLLVPVEKITGNQNDTTVIGVPFLSSIATIPRALATAGVQAAQGNIGKAATTLGQTGASVLIKPIADIAANQDYFGKPIITEDMSTEQKFKAQGAYLFNQYIGAHPYVKELLNPANREDPAYQRISRAMEMPLRFYTDSSLNTKYYYGAKDAAYNALSPQEQSAFDAIPVAKNDPNNPNNSMTKYQLFLQYPAVFEAKQKIELQTAAQTGKPIDPLYLVNYDMAKKYMRYESLPPGSQDRKDMTKAYPELSFIFDARSKYFNENPIPNQTPSARPVASPEIQAAMDRKDWNFPGVKAYLTANTAWNNAQREKLFLPPVGGGGGSSYNPDKYRFSNLKSKQKASVKSILSKLSKKLPMPKFKKAKAIKVPKAKKIAKRSLKSILVKAPIFTAVKKAGGGEKLPEDQVKGAQETPSYCGPAAMAYVMKHLGNSVTQDELAKKLDTTKQGTDNSRMVDTAKAMGHKVVVLEGENPKPILSTLSSYAMIGKYGIVDYVMGTDPKDDGHYAVFIRKSGDTITLWNPWDGKKETRSIKAFIEKWKGMGDPKHEQPYKHWALIIK